MWSLRVVIVDEPPEPAARAGRTAVPDRIEAVRPLFECLKPPLDVIPPAVLHPTAQSQTGQSGPVAEAVEQQFRPREVVALSETRQERRRGVDPASAEQLDVQDQQRIEVNRGVTPPPLCADLNCGLVDCNPPRSAPRRAGQVLCKPWVH